MSTLSLILIIFGLSIMLSRGPLVIAPIATRDTYKKLFNSALRMRLLGGVFTVVAAYVYWLTMNEPSLTGQIVRYFAGFIAVLGLVVFIIFAGPASRLAMSIWGAFPPNVLRGLGALAVAFGAWLVYLGLTL